MKIFAIPKISKNNIAESKVRVALKGNQPEKTKRADEPNLNSNPKNLLGSSQVQFPAWKKLTAKKFSTATKENYEPSVGRKPKIEYKYIQENCEVDKQQFHPSLKPKTLKTTTEAKAGIDLMNLAYPNGSIAISSKLDEVLSTSEMWQCAAVSFVNKKDNTQVLLHLCPGIHKPDNEALIEYIMKNMKQEELEIGVAPGCYSDTDNTISFLVENIKKHNKNAKIEFYNFPNKSGRVILENGELKHINENLFTTTERNPINRIFYASR